MKRDEAGNIIFPIEIDKQTRVLALGTLKSRVAFHTANYIFPVGYSPLCSVPRLLDCDMVCRYKSERDYVSSVDPTKRVTYANEILEEGEHPMFKVTPSDDVDRPVIAASASSAWKTILDRVNDRRQEGSKKTSISGPGPTRCSASPVVLSS